MAESEYDREMAEVLQYAEEAEVVCVIMPLINQCLVYDSRNAEDDPPRIWVSAPLGSGERRLRHVNRARPHMPHARELAVIPWNGSVHGLEDSSVWEMLQRRMGSAGFRQRPGVVRPCAARSAAVGAPVDDGAHQRPGALPHSLGAEPLATNHPRRVREATLLPVRGSAFAAKRGAFARPAPPY